MFILDDDVEAQLHLPRDYGVDDIPVIVQDKTFNGDGQLVEGHQQNPGMFGDTILVNGTLGPHHEVRHERVRLRLLNGSTARTYAFGFSDDRTFALIGTDGGLLAEPHDTDRVRLSPGERAEVVVSVKPDERVVLRSYPPDLGLDGTTNRQAGGEDSFDVLELRAGATLESSPPVPDRLVDIPHFDPADAAETRHFELRSRRINGNEMDMPEPCCTQFDPLDDATHNTSPAELPLHTVAINQLARLRVERGLTQQHVARAMGVSQPRVSDIERAELGHAQLDTIRAYIGALGGRLQLLAHWGDQQ